MFSKFYKKYGYFIFLTFLILSLFDMRFAIAAIACMILPIIFASFKKGRYWCGNYCPRGNFYDNVLSKFSSKNKTPKFLNSSFFRVFMILFILTNFGLGIYKNWGNLYGIGFVFYKIVVVTSLVGIFLSFFYNHRTWCNFCPMGTLSSLIAKFRGRNVNIEISNTCVECGLCDKSCPIGISPKSFKNDVVKDLDCLLCKKCVYNCPKKSMSFNK